MGGCNVLGNSSINICLTMKTVYRETMEINHTRLIVSIVDGWVYVLQLGNNSINIRLTMKNVGLGSQFYVGIIIN